MKRRKKEQFRFFCIFSVLFHGAAIELKLSLNRFQLNPSVKKKKRNMCRAKIYDSGERKLFLHSKTIAKCRKLERRSSNTLQRYDREGNECVNWVIGLKVFLPRMLRIATSFRNWKLLLQQSHFE